jgi:hypothetical protein
MQQEVGPRIAVQCIDDLFVIARAQCCHDQTLGFATCEQRGTVGPWQKASFTHDWAHLCR